MPRLLPFCAGALALLPFVPALGAGFVNWDDTAMLLSQTGYRSLGARGLG